MENPKTVQEIVDAAWNHVEQVGLALGIGDQKHALRAKSEAARLLSVAVGILNEEQGSGVSCIAEERQRQITSFGWTAEHDDEHRAGELVTAAVGYGLAAGMQIRGNCGWDETPEDWPWSDWWNPSANPLRNLEKAGALIAAEIDRLKRKGGSDLNDARELSPCPHCGGIGEDIMTSPVENADVICCAGCGAETEGHEPGRGEHILAWNGGRVLTKEQAIEARKEEGFE